MAERTSNQDNGEYNEENKGPGSGAETLKLGEQFGNDYGFGREGEHLAPQGSRYDGGQEKSEYVDRYSRSDYSPMLMDLGSHSGCGPWNCNEASGKIFEQVCVLLTRHGEIDASGIELKVDDTIVILNGTIESLKKKQLAVEIAGSVSGVSRVDNHLQVEK